MKSHSGTGRPLAFELKKWTTNTHLVQIPNREAEVSEDAQGPHSSSVGVTPCIYIFESLLHKFTNM